MNLMCQKTASSHAPLITIPSFLGVISDIAFNFIINFPRSTCFVQQQVSNAHGPVYKDALIKHQLSKYKQIKSYTNCRIQYLYICFLVPHSLSCLLPECLHFPSLHSLHPPSSTAFPRPFLQMKRNPTLRLLSKTSIFSTPLLMQVRVKTHFLLPRKIISM